MPLIAGFYLDIEPLTELFECNHPANSLSSLETVQFRNKGVAQYSVKCFAKAQVGDVRLLN